MAKWENAPVVEAPKKTSWTEAPLVEEEPLSPMASSFGLPPSPPPGFEAGRQKLPEKGMMGEEALRVLGGGAYEAVMGIPNALRSGVEAVIPEALKAKGERPGQDLFPIQETIKKATTPKTKGGQSVANIIAAGLAARTGGGALGSAGKFSKQALNAMTRTGVAGGVGAEAAGRVTDENPIARFAGALVGGGIHGITEKSLTSLYQMAANKSKVAELARVLTQGTTDDQIKAANELQKMAAETQGVKLTGGQVLPQSNLPAFEKIASQYPQGASLAKTFRAQPEQVVSATKAMQGKVPGQSLPVDEALTQSQSAATQAAKGAKEWRSDLVRQDYGGQIPVETSLGFQKMLDEKLRTMAQGTDKYELIARLKSSLTKQVGTETMPVISTQELKEQMRQVMNDAVSPSLGAKQYSTESRNELAATIKEIKKAIGEVKPSFAKAERNFARASRKVVNPMMEGPVGKMAGSTGYRPGKPSSQQELFSLLDKGTPNAAKSAILKTNKQLGRFAGEQGKAAFNDTYKTWLSKNVSESIEFDGSTVSPKTAKNLSDKFFKTAAKRQGFRDGAAAVADNVGMDPETKAAFVKGMENYLQTVASAANMTRQVGTAQGAVNEAAGTLLGKLNAITAFTPVRMPARWVNDYFRKRAVQDMSEMLSTPDGLLRIASLAKIAPASEEAFTAIGLVAPAAMQLEYPPQER